MTERKSIQDQLLDAIVYLPVGMYLSTKNEIPTWTSKGRAYLTNQVTMAKAIGQMAATFGSREAEKKLHQAVKRLGVLWGDKPAGNPPEGGGGEAGGTSGAGAGVTSAPGSAAGGAAPHSNGSGAVSGGSSGAPAPGALSGADLAIPGYDSLSASQVVQRLAGLSAQELHAVAAYESATRHRKTIVTRARQLLISGGAG